MSGKYRNKCIKPALAMLLLLLAQGAAAQNPDSLNLFEPVERQSTPEPQQIEQVPFSPAVVGSSEPFTMIGTSRLGDRWRARVRSPSGQVLTVDLDPNVPVVIPGYPGYSILAASTRELVIQHPASSPCAPRTDQGVSCTSGTEARLSIATASPIAPVQQAVRSVNSPVMSGSEPIPSEVPGDNPFAAALRAARERAETEGIPDQNMDAERFRPRRIDPSEVPQGSRLIRTPFGDRIITE